MIGFVPEFLQSPINTLGRYFDYQGIASRSEFWLFVLFSWISSFAVGLIDALARSTPFSAAIVRCRAK